MRTAGDAESSKTAMETMTTGGMCGEHDLQMQHHQQAAAAAFHVSGPSYSISTIISPPPPGLHQTSTTNVLNDDSFHVSPIMLQNQRQMQVQLLVQYNSFSGLIFENINSFKVIYHHFRLS